MLAALPDFPSGDGRVMPDVMTDSGLSLRSAGRSDLLFLRDLYMQTRAAELAPMPWSQEQKDRFIDDQFALQHRHYVQQYADADFLLIMQTNQSIGRLYVRCTPPDYLIVDIALLPQARRRGWGTALITAIQQHAHDAGCGVALHVDARNVGAQRLYRRLGFTVQSNDGAYWRLHWQVPVVVN